MLPGDLNRDARVNIADTIYLLSYLFGGGPDPWCMAMADMNGDAKINIADAVYLLAYLFGEGPPPLEPLEPCPE